MSGHVKQNSSTLPVTASGYGNVLSTNDTDLQKVTDRLDAHQHTVGVKALGLVTDNGDGTIDVASTDAWLYNNTDFTGLIAKYTIPAITNQALTDSSVNYIVVDYNSGTPQYSVLTSPNAINGSSIILVSNIYREGTELHIIDVDFAKATSIRVVNRLIQQQRFVRISGLALSESGTRYIDVGSGVVYYGIRNFNLLAVNSNTDTCELYYHSSGNWTKTTITAYDNTQYDDGTDLQTLSNNKYCINWVYRFIENPKHIAVTLGSSDYSLTDALNSQPPAPPIVLSRQAILVGRIVVEKSASTSYQIDSAFVTTYETMPVKDHNDLGELQGGTVNEYYHLTASELAGISTSKKFNGFVNRTDSSIAMNSSNFEITTGSSYTLYVNGVSFIKNSTQSVAIANDKTLHYVYYDSAGVLQVSTSVWSIISLTTTPVAIVFKDGSNYAVTDERHGYYRDLDWHRWAHLTIGTRYYSGFTGTFDNTTLSVTQGVIYDEDIDFDSGGTKTTCAHWIQDTGLATMRYTPAQTTPYAVTGGELAYDNLGTLTKVAQTGGGRYVTNFIFANGNPSEPIYTVIGQSEDATLTDAQNAPMPNIYLSTAEWKLIYKVIYRNVAGTATFVQSIDMRSVSNGPATVATSTSHASLTDRDLANSHPSSAIDYSIGLDLTSYWLKWNSVNVAKVFSSEGTNDVTIFGAGAGATLPQATSGYQVLIGTDAGKSLEINSGRNTFIGCYAGTLPKTSFGNTAIGMYAMDGQYNDGSYTWVSGYNVAVGIQAMWMCDTLSGSVAIGALAAMSVRKGSSVTAIGYNALRESNATMTATTAIGGGAGYYYPSSYSTLIGSSAGSVASGDRQILIGFNCATKEDGAGTLMIDSYGRGDKTQDRNNAIIYGTMSTAAASQTLGFNANIIANYGYNDVDFTIRKLTSGNALVYDAGLDKFTLGSNIDFTGGYGLLQKVTSSENYVWGTRAGEAIATTTKSVYIGELAGYTDTAGLRNIGIGYGACQSRLTATDNIGIGYSSNITMVGSYNIGIGTQCLAGSATPTDNTGSSNVAIGLSCMSGGVLTSGMLNIAIGNQALYRNTTGSFNIALGNGAGSYISSGGGNVAIGHGALPSATTGLSNVAIGSGAGTGVTLGTGNVLIGERTGYTGDHNSCLILGYRAGEMSSGDYHIIFDNRFRTNEAGELNSAPFYATTDATVSNQNVRFNGNMIANFGYNDCDFTIRKLTSGNALAYDCGALTGAGQFTVSSYLETSQDVKITDKTKGVILIDRTTDTPYRVFMEGGILKQETL